MHHRGQLCASRPNFKPAFVSVTQVAGLRINVLDVPEVAQAGHTVRLTCDYDLERARLYQVNVYLVVNVPIRIIQIFCSGQVVQRLSRVFPVLSLRRAKDQSVYCRRTQHRCKN